jgi:hypothetical protein
MQIYTLKEAARKAKMGVETLKRACEDGLIQATRLTNGQWRIAESPLSAAMHQGLDLRSLPKRKKKQAQPEALRRAQKKRKEERFCDIPRRVPKNVATAHVMVLANGNRLKPCFSSVRGKKIKCFGPDRKSGVSAMVEQEQSREEWRQQQAEVEQHLLTLWQQKHALQFQIELMRELRQSLVWHRQERERIRQERQRVCMKKSL